MGNFIAKIQKHGAIKAKQKNVFSPICNVCGADLKAVKSNAEASRVLAQHKKAAHPGLDFL